MIWLATLFPKTRLCPATRMVKSPSSGLHLKDQEPRSQSQMHFIKAGEQTGLAVAHLDDSRR